MNAVERFFRRYILSTVGILVLFFTVNLLLLGTFALILYLNGAADSSFPTEEFSGHIVLQNGELTADASAQELLQHAKAWAMILRDDGKVIWEEGLPEELPRQYSVTDVALFSRWYLNDYPIHIWKRTDGLLVIGFPPGSVIQFYSSTQSRYALPSLTGIAVIFVINILLMIYLFLRNVRRIERSIEPILEGIHSLSLGKAFRLLRDRWRGGLAVSLPALTAELESGEMSHLAGVLDQPESLQNGRQAMRDYIEIIENEAEKRRLEGDKDALLAVQKKLLEKKGYGG